MQKRILTFTILCLWGRSIFAGPEISTGYGYMS